MLPHAMQFCLSERASETCRTLVYAALAVPLLSNLHVPGPMLALTLAAFTFPAARNFVDSHRERHGDKLPAPKAHRDWFGERREFDDRHVNALLEKRNEAISFAEMVTDAAYFSNEYGRRLSVIYVRIPQLSRESGSAVLRRLRDTVRTKDEVQAISDEEFLVCSHLLRDASAAIAIASRIERALLSNELLSASTDIQIGRAIYPMDGYSGVDLINHARGALRSIKRPIA